MDRESWELRTVTGSLLSGILALGAWGCGDDPCAWGLGPDWQCNSSGSDGLGGVPIPQPITPIGLVVQQRDVPPGRPPGSPESMVFRVDLEWSRVIPASEYFVSITPPEGANLTVLQARAAYGTVAAFALDAHVDDHLLEGWQWQVRALSVAGRVSNWSRSETFSFAPCRSDDGGPCQSRSLSSHFPRPLAPARSARIPQNNPEIGGTPHPTAGYGFLIDYSWTAVESATQYRVEAGPSPYLGDPPPWASMVIWTHQLSYRAQFPHRYLLGFWEKSWSWKVSTDLPEVGHEDFSVSGRPVFFSLGDCALPDGSLCSG